MILLKSAALVALAAAAAPATAQMVRPQDPQTLVQALQQGGYAAQLAVDDTGDPMIRGMVGGTRYQLLFYNCTDHKECATIQFHVGYHLKTPVTLAALNEWNRSQRFGSAYLDKENDPILEMDVDLDDGGVSQLLFIDNVEFWTSAVQRFEKSIGYSN